MAVVGVKISKKSFEERSIGHFFSFSGGRGVKIRRRKKRKREEKKERRKRKEKTYL